MQIKSKYKVARRLGIPLFEKTQNAKFAARVASRKAGTKKHPRALSDYGRQLLEKQKVRYTYLINERQLKKYVQSVLLKKGIKQDEKLYEILETRLDNVAHKLGFGASKLAVRQIVNHGHIMVNGKRVDVASNRVRPGDKISIKASSLNKGVFAALEQRLKDWKTPSWIKLDPEKKEGLILSMPKLEKDIPSDLTMVLEYYKR